MKKHALPALAVAAIGLLLLACGGGSGGGEKAAFFDLGDADAAAHAALVEEDDLPGGGWEVTGRDEQSDSSIDFATLSKQEPSCSQIAGLLDLGSLGGVFGNSEDTSAPAAWAQVSLERATAGGVFPTSVEVEVELEETVAGVQGSWKLVKDLLDSKDTRTCIAAMLNREFKDQFSASGIDVTLEPRASSKPSPHDGASMSLSMLLKLQRVATLDVVMEMYFWPYGNGKVTVVLAGTKDDLTPALVGDLLAAIDKKIVAAEKAY